MTATNAETTLNQIKRNLGLPVSNNRSIGESNVIIDAAPFVSAFSKGERIYRMADWTMSTDSRSASAAGSNQSRIRGSTAGLNGLEGEEYWTLSLTETSKPATNTRKVLGPRAARGVLPPKTSTSTARTQARPATAKVKKLFIVIFLIISIG